MKTLRIDDDIHELIINKIKELKEQHDVSVKIESVVTKALKIGIPLIKFSEIKSL